MGLCRVASRGSGARAGPNRVDVIIYDELQRHPALSERQDEGIPPFRYHLPMSSSPETDATVLMAAAAAGDAHAARDLLPLVYEQLRKAAQKQLASERAGITLSATALVHEAYLKLVGPRKVPWAGRSHFYTAAAQAMRQILIDHARSRAGRAGREVRLEDVDDIAALADANFDQIMAVDAAISRLESEDAEAATVVRLRFFAGLSVDEVAAALQTSPRSVARLWAYARAILFQSLSDPE